MEDLHYSDDKTTILTRKILKHLAQFYMIENIEEVVLNRPEEVWIKMKGGDWERKPAPELTYNYIKRVCQSLANINNSEFSEDVLPVVSCELPGLPFRFQAVMGPNVKYKSGDRFGCGIAIRSLVASKMEFSSWNLRNNQRLPGSQKNIDDFEGVEQHVGKIQAIIDSHQSIIVSGMTSCGKTTFTNRLIEMIDPNARVLTVEDTRELTVPQDNHLHLMVPRNVSGNRFTWNSAVNALMRMTPDWVICGELSIENAETIYSLMGKGHPIITTIHAGTPAQALNAIAINMAANKSDVSNDSVMMNLKSLVGCVIQLERSGGKRFVSDISFPIQEYQEAISKQQKSTV